jgi:UPF0042 nucleotide-binding protein
LTHQEAFPLVVVTGLSGAGKSSALNVFEDLGFFCVDGIPSSMVSRLISLFKDENPRDYRGLAIGMDIRQHGFMHEGETGLPALTQEGHRLQLVFLEAATEVLLRRYATTRRPHPLECRELGLEQALEKERELLEPLRREAELVIDTSDFSIHDLRRHLQEEWDFLSDTSQGLRIHIISFGFKYGVPKEADLVFDLRFLPNPFFEEALRPLSGMDEQVASYVLEDEPGKGFIRRFLDFLNFILPLYAREGRYRLTMALGCTGGRHRSVAVAAAVHRRLLNNSYRVTVENRHLELG